MADSDDDDDDGEGTVSSGPHAVSLVCFGGSASKKAGCALASAFGLLGPLQSRKLLSS
jgi:hypothetical protein